MGGLGWRVGEFVFSARTRREMLRSGVPSLSHPQLSLFPPSFPLPSLSFLYPLACRCPVWIHPDLPLSPSFPSHSSVLPSHPHFTPPQITSCLYGGRGYWIALPQPEVQVGVVLGAQPLGACESALSSGLVCPLSSPPLGRSQVALGPACSPFRLRRGSTLGGDGA